MTTKRQTPRLMTQILKDRWQKMIHQGKVELTASITSHHLLKYQETRSDGYELYTHCFDLHDGRIYQRTLAVQQISAEKAMQKLARAHTKINEDRLKQQDQPYPWADLINELEMRGYYCTNYLLDENIILADGTYYHTFRVGSEQRDPKKRTRRWWQPAKPHKKRKPPKKLSKHHLDFSDTLFFA